MKHLLTAIACFFALSMSAQEALPWNPNANNDNIIGTVDLLAMLNVYGEEYSVETCFRGEAYYASIWTSIPPQNIIYIPSDAGIVECRCDDNSGCHYRFESSIPNGTVVYVSMNRDYYYATNPFSFESFDGDNWVTFYSHSGTGDNKGKLVFQDGAWSGFDHADIVLPPAAE